MEFNRFSFLSEMDTQIGSYILAHPNNDFCDVVRTDRRWEVIRQLSDLPRGLLGWYPFSANCSVLQVEAGFGALTGQLCAVCGHVTALENDPYRAVCLRKRYEALANLTVAVCGIEEVAEKFDYVIYVADADANPPKTLAEYRLFIERLKARLRDGGKLLLAVPNRFGVKYLCGAPDPESGVPFDGIAGEGLGYRFGRRRLLACLREAGFEHVKLYYPLPDHQTPQLIYTDAYPPQSDLCERLRPFIVQKGSRVLPETELIDALVKDGELLSLANSFLAECGDGACSDILYAAVSAERRREEAFATNIRSNNTVEKVALYGEGTRGLARLAEHTCALAARDVPVLPLEVAGRSAVMRRVRAPSLSEHIRCLAERRDGAALLACVDKLYEYILASSEMARAEDNALRQLAPDEDWGPILRRAYIEMIPVNCFYINGDFLFFDQEFSRANYPAKYILFRALRDIYAFSPAAEAAVPFESIKARYGLARLWDAFQREEWRFQRELRQEEVYARFFAWIANDDAAMLKNRRALQMGNYREAAPKTSALFHAVAELGQRRIILFGAGKMAVQYLDKYGAAHPPLFMVDNNAAKWGTFQRGLAVKAPEALRELAYGTFRVVIASNAYVEIAAQLERMGIYADSFRIYQRRMDELLPLALQGTVTDGKYNIGYVTGVFDLFHIGHLNLLRRCKERCHYLIAGVLTDALVERDKQKKPYIPFEERMEIVKQCRYVDRVVPVDFRNTDKVEAWATLRYGCLFSGSDHEGEAYWMWLQKRLRSLGAELEFFPYTQGTSSTLLQAAIRARTEGA